MATLHIQDVPDDLYERLQQLAAAQKRSINAQVVNLLESALQAEFQQHQDETPKFTAEILAESRRRREQLPTDLGLPDSTTLIREDRDR